MDSTADEIVGSTPPPPPVPLLDDISSGMGGLAFDGEAASDLAGFAVGGVGDVNGDGLADFAVGAYGNDHAGSGAGQTYVVFGQSSFAAGLLDLSDVGGTVAGFAASGAAAGDSSGWSVDGGGDFDGDGLADLLIGARNADPSSRTNAGRTYLILGNTGLGSADVPLYTIEYGYGIGNAYGVVIDGAAAGDNSGYALADAGDVNGDGFDDVIIGAPYADPNGTSSGRAYLVYGGEGPWQGGTIDLADVAAGIGGVVFDGETTSDYAGVSVDGAGDVNGDGYDDLVIAAVFADPNGSSSGRVYVVYGDRDLGPGPIALSAVATGTGGFAIDGEAANDDAGRGVAGAGDVNDDGYADPIIGAPGHASDTGRAYVVFGSASVASSPVDLSAVASGTGGMVFDGLAAGDLAGWAVDAIGDSNQDGLADVVVSAHRRDSTATSVGAAYVVYGGDHPGLTADTSILSRVDASDEGGFTMLGENAYDYAGRAVRGVGDVDGDDVPDLLVGAAYADAAGTSAGRVYLVLGDPTRGTYHPYNRNPQTEPEDYYVTQGGSLSVSGPGVLDNDWDADGTVPPALAATPDSLTSARGGTVTVYADGAFDFTGAHPQWWGEDSFEYEVTDDAGGSSMETVRILAVPEAVPLDSVAAGETGYALDGADAYEGSGQAVCHVGDIDDDGHADFLVGAFEADPGGDTSAGVTYVRYGEASVTSPVSMVAGATDARGEAALDWSGIAVGSAGDFNGDGFDDFVIGAIGADPNGDRSGRSYVVFGSSSRPDASLSGLDGSNGFVLEGEMPGDDSGRAVSTAGDVNGDGYDDLLIGAYRADGPGLDDEGRVYLVYGTDTAMLASLELADVGGSVAGVAIEGEWNNDYAGFAVAGPGDLDGDGYVDVAIGAYGGPGGTSNAGRTYVVYGGPALPSTIVLDDVEDSTNAPLLGVAIDGETSGDLSGRAVSGAGDVNGDGVVDLLIGAPGWGTVAPSIGRAYVVFGGAAFSPGSATIELADVAAGVGGFAIEGEQGEDGAGAAVAAAGDFNGDGYADFLVGAPLASGLASFGSGRAYLIVGQSDFSGSPVVHLEDIASGIGGFAIDGELSFDSVGHAVGGGGDVDRDGFSDLLVGGFNAGPSVAGRTYVLYGGDYIQAQN